jgi:hypothetical protein
MFPSPTDKKNRNSEKKKDESYLNCNVVILQRLEIKRAIWEVPKSIFHEI